MQKINVVIQNAQYTTMLSHSDDKPAYFTGAIYCLAASILNLDIKIYTPGLGIAAKCGSILDYCNVMYTIIKKCKTLNVVWQGYGVQSIFLGLMLRLKLKYLVNTYKIPRNTSVRISTTLNDKMLFQTIRKAAGVVTIAKFQQEKLAQLNSNVLFLPFASDINWWTHKEPDEDILRQHGIMKSGYILIPGDVDRDEETIAYCAKKIGQTVVRVTRDKSTAQRAYETWRRIGLRTGVILTNVTFKTLRELYRGAKVVVIPAISNIHPSGMTSMTEAISCGRPIVIPEGLTTEGYVYNMEDAFILKKWSKTNLQDILKFIYETDIGDVVGKRARRTAEERVNLSKSAEILANFLKKIL